MSDRSVTLSDTSREAQEVQVRLLREAGLSRRLELTLSLSSDAIRASRRALAEQNPELDDLGVRLLWAEIHYGAEPAQKVRERLAERHE